MALLTRDQILQASDIKTEAVEVPEWGGTVMVRGLTGKQRDGFEQEITQQKGAKTTMNLANARAKLVQLSVIGDDGALLFSREDVSALGAKSAAALQRVFDVASRLSGLSTADMDELTKNSASDQSGDSLSA